MWLLVSFIAIWALSPGPVAVMTLNEARKKGSAAGVAVSAGASLTAALMVIVALLVHTAGFSPIFESDSMAVIEKLGAGGIILMGLYAGYKCLNSAAGEANGPLEKTRSGICFLQGMMIMATYIPQALLYYNIIVPQTVDVDTVYTTILVLGALKVGLIFVWHAGLALAATRTRFGTKNRSLSTVLELSLACLIVAMGVNIMM